MRQKECVAMILAGGKGVRLGSLTNKNLAKPAIYFGGKYRIIDFTLSNCKHSGMDTLGVLTQYRYSELHEYIDSGQAWGLNKIDGGVFMLHSHKSVYYTGTADAVYQNIDFVERFNPEYVLILSGDQIYKMDYRKMLNFHKKTNADATIAVTPVPLEEASRFGIMSTDENGLITEFAEKPKMPKGNLASMGIYIFKWSRLKEYLITDKDNILSQNDFGKNIIPTMLLSDEKLYAYQFDSYWRDVGTIQSLWESNMDLISNSPKLDLSDDGWEILTKSKCRPPCCISGNAEVKGSIVAEGCSVYGKVKNTVLFNSVTVCEGAEVIDSIVMPGAFISKNAKIHKSIIGANVYIGENVEIGADDGLNNYFDNNLCTNGISLVGPGICVNENIKIGKNSHVDKAVLLNECQATVVNRAMVN